MAIKKLVGVTCVALTLSACTTHRERTVAGASHSAAPVPTRSHGTCSGAAIDYVSSAHGEPSASAALGVYIRQHRRLFGQRGWSLGSSSSGLVTFAAGSSRIETSRLRDGSWVVTGYSLCK